MNVSVLSYNVFCRPPFIHTNDDDYKSERLHDIVALDRFQPYDIVCLQELFRFASTKQHVFIKGLQGRGFLYSTVIQSGNNTLVHLGRTSGSLFHWPPAIIDGGIVIVSRFPICLAREICFSEACGYDAYAKKGALHIRVKLSAGGNKYLDVYNVHLQSVTEGNDEEQRAQWSQISELKRFVASGITRSIPVLLCGDFNIDGEFDALYSRLHTELCSITGSDVSTACVAAGDALKRSGVLQCSDLVKTGWVAQGHSEQRERLVTYGDQGRETVLTSPKDRCLLARLDYIWLLGTPGAVKKVTLAKGGVAPMQAAADRPYSQLSDHYAVYASINM